MSKEKEIVVLPAYNAALTIKRTLDDITTKGECLISGMPFINSLQKRRKL